MKRFTLLGFALIILIIKIDAQTPIKNAVPDYRKFYQKIKTYNGKVLDKRSGNSNVYQQNYHGGNNQQWLIMPLHQTSSDAIIINRQGKVLDRHLSHGNLYCHKFRGVHSPYGDLIALPKNQIFRFDQQTDGSVIIKCDNSKVGDICLSSQHKDPFDHPSRSKNNLYAGTQHNGNNQKFRFFNDAQLSGSSELVSWRIFDNPSDVQIDMPPAPESLHDQTLTGTTTPKVQIAQTYIPCIWVNDPGRDFNWKINNSPYYIVKQYTYYQLFDSFLAGDLLEEITSTWDVEIGITKTAANQVSHTMGFTHKYDGGITDVYNSSVSKDFKSNLVVTQTFASEFEKKERIQVKKEAGEECLTLFWQRVVKYELWRMNESYPIFEWSILTKQNKLFVFPRYLEVKEKPSDTKDIDHYYEICTINKSVPFSVTSSNIGAANAWDVQYTDGADKTYRIHLSSEKTITVSTDYNFTDFDTKIEIFNEDYTSTGYYNDNASSHNSGNYGVSKLVNITLSAGTYYIVVDGYNGAEGNFKLSVTDNQQPYSPPTVNNSGKSMLKSSKTNLYQQNAEVKIFPNPVSTFFTIQFPESQNSQITLVDINGRIVKRLSTQQNEIDIDCSELPDGIYNLRIDNGINSTLRKVIVQH